MIAALCHFNDDFEKYDRNLLQSKTEEPNLDNNSVKAGWVKEKRVWWLC